MPSKFDLDAWQAHGRDNDYCRQWPCPIATCNIVFSRPHEAITHMLNDHSEICASKNIVAMRIVVKKADNSPDYIPSSFYDESIPNKYFHNRRVSSQLHLKKSGKRMAKATSSAGHNRQTRRKTSTAAATTAATAAATAAAPTATPAPRRGRPAKATSAANSTSDLAERYELKAELKAQRELHAAKARLAKIEEACKLKVQKAEDKDKLRQMEKRAELAEERNKSKDALLQERNKTALAWQHAALAQPQGGGNAVHGKFDAAGVFLQ